MIKGLIRTHGLEKEIVALMLVGRQTEITKLFPDIEFTSIQGLLYKFAIVAIEGIPTHCIAYDDNRPLRIILYTQQNV